MRALALAVRRSPDCSVVDHSTALWTSTNVGWSTLRTTGVPCTVIARTPRPVKVVLNTPRLIMARWEVGVPFCPGQGCVGGRVRGRRRVWNHELGCPGYHGEGRRTTRRRDRRGGPLRAPSRGVPTSPTRRVPCPTTSSPPNP